MSWDAYITNLLSAKIDSIPVVAKGAICGRDPASCWAASEGFCVTADEIAVFKCDKLRSSSVTDGIKLGGTKFMLLRDNMNDEDFPCLQLRSKSDENGVTVSATVAKTNQAYVVAIASKEIPAGKLSDEVFRISNYLRNTGF